LRLGTDALAESRRAAVRNTPGVLCERYPLVTPFVLDGLALIFFRR
jgi:hypothetical protein